MLTLASMSSKHAIPCSFRQTKVTGSNSFLKLKTAPPTRTKSLSMFFSGSASTLLTLLISISILKVFLFFGSGREPLIMFKKPPSMRIVETTSFVRLEMNSFNSSAPLTEILNAFSLPPIIQVLSGFWIICFRLLKVSFFLSAVTYIK